MTIPVNVFVPDLGIQLGDPTNTVWLQAQLLSFIKRAYRISYPWFFTPVVDDTTYTGANAVPMNTHKVDVPQVFLSAQSLTDVSQPGEVTGLQVRLTGTTTPVEPIPQVWFPVANAGIDPLSIYPNQQPQIRFLSPFNNIFELKVYGCSPLAIPTVLDGSPLPGSDNAGFMEWLTFQCMVYAMANKETNTNDDKRGYGRRHLIDQADADKLRWRYRMSKPQYTAFKLIAR